jgi:Bacterial archaeo-eukaryotic release factor family 10
MITAQTIDQLIGFRADGLPVVSLYVAIAPGTNEREIHARVNSLLDELDESAKDDATEHDWRLSLRADIERIKVKASEEIWAPHGLAIFACNARNLYEEVPLPQRVHDRVVIDETPFLGPMLGVLDQYQRSCVVIVDKESARAFEVYQDEMRELPEIRDRILRKPNFAAGRGEYHVRNKADELNKRHYRHVAQILDELFRGGRYDLLIVGGHEFEVPAFLEFLPRELSDRVAGTFTIDPATAPVNEIRAAADTIVQRYEDDRDQQLLEEILDKHASGGLGAVGMKECLWAGSVAGIRQLLVAEGASAPGVVCDDSGWLALAGDTCPFCGKPTRSTPDVIEELVVAVIDEGGSVDHAGQDAKLADYTLAARLRFPLPPMDAAS